MIEASSTDIGACWRGVECEGWEEWSSVGIALSAGMVGGAGLGL